MASRSATGWFSARAGSSGVPEDRTGQPIRLVLDDGTDIADERVLDYAPSYRLEPLAATLFGGERPWRYDFDFKTTDRKLIALEYAELATCIRTGAKPEVDGAAGRRAVALVHALFESQVAGRPVTLAEIESGAVDAYQRESTSTTAWSVSAKGAPGCSLRTAPGECRRSRSRPRWPTAQRSGSTDSS